jgi:hypothetical protein
VNKRNASYGKDVLLKKTKEKIDARKKKNDDREKKRHEDVAKKRRDVVEKKKKKKDAGKTRNENDEDRHKRLLNVPRPLDRNRSKRSIDVKRPSVRPHYLVLLQLHQNQVHANKTFQSQIFPKSVPGRIAPDRSRWKHSSLIFIMANYDFIN